MLPSYEVWSELVHITRSSGTREWKALDEAYKLYSSDPDNQLNRDRLVAALNAFDDKKRDSEGNVQTRRDAKGALTALRKHLSEKRDVVDVVALNELGWAQRNAMFRALTRARIEYKSSSPLNMAKEAKENAEAFLNDLEAIPGMPSLSAGGSASSAPAYNPAPHQWQALLQSITGLGEELGRDAMNALTREIGQHTMNAIADAIPILGTVKGGMEILRNLKHIVDNELIKYRADQARVYTRAGDIQVAINNMQRILSERRVSLGLELAGSVTSFTTSVASVGIAGPIASAAVSGAKLVYMIYNFVADHVAMTRANQVLQLATGARRPMIETMGKFPFLGACLISKIETSTLLDFNGIELNDPFFGVMIDYYRTQVQVLRDTAHSIVLESRFELVTPQPPDIAVLEVRNRFQDSLNEKLAEAIETMRARADHKQKMAAVFDEMKARQEAKDRAAHQRAFSPVMEQLKQQATTLEMMVLMNEEIEREAARLIDIRAMKETREQQEEARLKALQQKVQNVLSTYREQTSGYKSFITRQSNESTAAIEALTPLAASASIQDLRKLKSLVEYLLKKPGAASPPPGTVKSPLKQPSRLYDLLNPAYTSAPG